MIGEWRIDKGIEFTPGPWKLIKEVNHWTVGAEGMPEIGQILQEANANLISAAPDLYDALKEARDALCSHPDYQTKESLAMFDAAIAKAEGR
jgi:hypothetical protein